MEDKTVNKIVSLVILNATTGVVLKGVSAFSPVFSMYYEFKYFHFRETNFYNKMIRTCYTDIYCNTMDTFGKFLFLLNLTIPFCFFYKFDNKFHQGFYNLVGKLKIYLK